MTRMRFRPVAVGISWIAGYSLATVLVANPVGGAAADLIVPKVVPVTPSPKPPSFYSKLEDLAGKLFQKRQLTEHPQPEASVSVADFSIYVTRALEIPAPKASAPPGVAHSYYKAASSLAALYDIAIAYAIKPLSASLAAHFPHANVSGSEERLRVIPIDRETAAEVAFSSAYQQHVFPDAPPPPPEPAPFADEARIRPGPVLRACHGAVDEGLIWVGPDNLFHPHAWLTWREFVNMLELLRYYRQHAGP